MHPVDGLTHRLGGRLGPDQPPVEIDIGLRDRGALNRRVRGHRQLDAGEQDGLGSQPQR